eukprot:TRINITY_DN222_c0_g7_i2.p1 TRINITY_DN222_c0_g7~~TRINITY_DN222_c0_g7_i2.p1  ORF type:complete len:608 (-),score=166.44 TRINITY_DN222_c0_g7_i2:1096-2919(-)
MYLVRNLRVVPTTTVSSGSTAASSVVVPARGVRNEALSYGAAKKKSRKISRIYPLPAWAVNNPELQEHEKVEVWKTVQFLGGKDPLQLLALDLIDKLKDAAPSRTYYTPESVRNEMFELWSKDPIVNSDSALAIRYRISRPRVIAILKLKSREKEQRDRGELAATAHLDEEWDAAATKYLSPATDKKVLDDKLLLRNRISKPHASHVPAEVNMRVLNKILPVATRNKTWEDQLPKDYKPQPLLHIPSPNKLWKNDEPLKAPYRTGFPATKESRGEPSEKTLTRKLGAAFQTVEANGKVRKATIWEARQLLSVLQPKRRDRYDPTLDASAEPVPDELAIDNLKNSLNPDQIHLARFFRTLSKTWDVEQKEIEEQTDSSLDKMNITSLRPSDLMAFEKDQFAYLHYVKRAITRNSNVDPPGVRSMDEDEKVRSAEERGEEVEQLGPFDDRRPTDTEAGRFRVKLKRNAGSGGGAGAGAAKKKQPKLPKAKKTDDVFETEVATAQLRAEDEFKQPVVYDTSGDIWRAEVVETAPETPATPVAQKAAPSTPSPQRSQARQKASAETATKTISQSKQSSDVVKQQPQRQSAGKQRTTRQPQKSGSGDVWKQS